jgi:hypothetical protein
VLLAVVFCMAVWRFEWQGLKNYFAYYPPIAKHIDEVAEKQHLFHGVGNHWISKKVTMFSRKGVKIRTVFEDLAIYDHVASDRWYFHNIFNFVVLNNFADTSLYRKYVKEPKTIRYDDELKLIMTRPFTYDRNIGYRAIIIGD